MKACISVKIGSGKNECEDTAIFNGTQINNQIVCIGGINLQCIGVADGVGGNAGGRMASSYIANQLAQTDFSGMTENGIRLFVESLNNELINYALTIPEKSGMATTLTCIVAALDGYYLIHAGNTRLYVKQGSYLKQLTTDHTTYNWFVAHGQYEAAEQCNKSEINCCLGGGNPQYAKHLVIEKLYERDFPDTILMTSDGIHEYVDIDFIEATLVTSKSDFDFAKVIMDKALHNGSTDDKTIIILKV